MLVSVGLSLMLTLSGQLVAPDGCSVVAVWDDGSAIAACADHHTWFTYDPHLTRHGWWSPTRQEPPALNSLKASVHHEQVPASGGDDGSP